MCFDKFIESQDIIYPLLYTRNIIFMFLRKKVQRKIRLCCIKVHIVYNIIFVYGDKTGFQAKSNILQQNMLLGIKSEKC